MKNIVFDLGGVLFARDARKCSPEFREFFAFIRSERLPEFWEEYDRGMLSLDEVSEILSNRNDCPRELCDEYLRKSIDLQEAIVPTERLIRDLKAAGYKLYVLSNMSRDYIKFLRRAPVYSLFDGEVVSCEEGAVKPEPRIYEILLERYNLDPADTLFIDDRPVNLVTARVLGIDTQLFDYHDPESACAGLRAKLL